MKTVKELELELREARALEDEERRERAKATKAVYQFTLKRVRDEAAWHPVYDDFCLLYRLTGKVLNVAELKSVGKIPFEGSMLYLFNGATGRFAAAISGGSIFTSDPNAFEDLSTFVADHAEGGDVTEIIERYREVK
jgi:hypothetical protein